jgi:hypothetical protein
LWAGIATEQVGGWPGSTTSDAGGARRGRPVVTPASVNEAGNVAAWAGG